MSIDSFLYLERKDGRYSYSNVSINMLVGQFSASKLVKIISSITGNKDKKQIALHLIALPFAGVSLAIIHEMRKPE